MDEHAPAPLPHDPLWPRAGGWPAPPDESAADGPAGFDAVLLGIGTWRTSLSPTGAGATPAAVREALRRYSPDLGSGGSLRGLRIVDAGDLADPDGLGDAAAAAEVARAAGRGRLLIALGGDNALTVPAMLGACGLRLAEAGLITLDAHHDLRDGRSNGSPVRRLLERGLSGARTVQLGIADFANSLEYAARAAEAGVTVVPRGDFERLSPEEIAERALRIAGAAGGPVHVDVDVDVCDRAVAPGCPASLPGGLSAWQLRRTVRLLARDPRVRSIDVAEVDAGADAPDGRTVRLAALCVLEALAGLAEREA
ncbi:MAG: arginase family protein [Pseudoclavibacter sp.]|nr:arginase family protein [Pseudoclavibacter sp.]